MPYQDFPLVDLKRGLYSEKEPALFPNDAFQVLTNCYLDNGRIRKRRGYSAFSQLETQAAQESQNGDGIVDQFTGTFSNLPVAPGSVSITDDTGTPQVVTDDGDGNLTGDVDGGGNNTVNYTTGAYDVTFAAPPPSGTGNVTFDHNYFRANPCMGGDSWTNAAGTSQLVMFDTDRVFTYNTGNGRAIDQIGSDTFTGSDSDYFWLHNFDDFLAITNNVDVPHKWDGSSLTVIDVTDLTQALTTALLVVKYKGRLVFFNTVEGGTAFPRRARWSSVFAFETFADENWSEADAPGHIVSAAFVGDQLIIYFDNPRSTYRFEHINIPLIGGAFRFTRIDDTLGSVATHASVSSSGRAITLDETQLTLTNGSTVELADTQIPKFVRERMSASGLAASHGTFVPDLRHAWLSYAAVEDVDDNQNHVLTFNLDTGAISIFDLPFNAYFPFTAQAAVTWLDLAGKVWNNPDDGLIGITWLELSEQIGSPILLGGDRSGLIRKLNDGADDAGTAFTSTIKTGRISPVKSSISRLGYVTIKADRNDVAVITVNFYKDYEDTPYYSTEVTLDAIDTRESKVERRVWVNQTATLHTIEIVSSDSNVVVIDEITPSFRVSGRKREVR